MQYTIKKYAITTVFIAHCLPSSFAMVNFAVQQLLVKWSNALLTQKPKKVAKLYKKGAVLLPTLGGIFVGREQIKEYFEVFLLASPQVTVVEEHIYVLNEYNAVNTGLYNITITDETGTTTIPARFSFVYKKHHGRWKIISHHSSVLDATEMPIS
jgi:uncharacterized protein (TIGR02246 family)